MDEEKKQAPDWVNELGTLLKGFFESHKGVTISIIASDDKGYWAHIPDYNIWNRQLYATLMNEPALFMPTSDAITEAYEHMEKAVKENQVKEQGIPFIVKQSKIKS